VTAELCDAYIDEELARAREIHPPARYQAYEHAAFLMRELIKAPKFQNFLTEPAYARVLDHEVFTA
jgi:malate synthase